MQKSQPDWRREKLVKIFHSYHSAIRARSHEGRQVVMCNFYAVLVHEGLRVERLGARPGQEFDPATGEGYLLVEGRYVLDVVCLAHITPYTVLCIFPPMPRGPRLARYRRLVFNFGSLEPEWYPCPMDAESIKAFIHRRWFLPLPTGKFALAPTQSTLVKWEAPCVR